MNCQILRTLYLKANGIIPCEDNRGEWIDLGKVSLDPDWSIEQVLNNEHYAQIRSALAAGEMPWPKTCADCAMLRPHQPVKDTIAQKRIEKLQIETTLACALRCPGCSSLGQLALRSKPHTLPLEIYERLLQSLADEGYRIDFIEYCGQGEPLAHPKFAEFVRIGRRLFPETKQRLVTNGNYSYAKKLEGEYIDEIYVSADGITQENYEKYRVRGNIELAKQFMRDAADPGAQMRPLLVWKYILFEFNHSDEEIRAAHDFAVEAKIGMLMFILTKTEYHSQRYTPQTYPNILLLAPSARLSMTPDFLREAENDQPRREARLNLVHARRWRARTTCHADFMGVYPGMISVVGWAAGLKGQRIRKIEIKSNGRSLGRAQHGLHRPEVSAFLGDPDADRAGFAFAAPWTGDTAYPERLDIHLTIGWGRTEHFVWWAERPDQVW